MEVSLVSLIEQFHDEEKDRKYLEGLKWPDGVKCPRCGSDKISRIIKAHKYDCDACRYQFTVTAGTIFHDSHLPLWKWFLAVYLMMESKKSISANQMKRTLSVSYKTAWYLCHRIRKAVEEATESPMLKGVVEVDETYVGGRYDKRRKRMPNEKQAVLGLIQRHGRLEVKAITTNGRKIIMPIIEKNVDKDATIMTDEYAAYRSLDKKFHHEVVKHSAEEWVRGDAHTNSIENAWSLFKRSVVGSFHKISAKHVSSYLDEFEWRFNGRNNPYLFKDTMIRLLNSPKMEFKELIGKEA
ncbi:MAG: IS1595 family transposase [Syntrophorhabdales bacterium]|jgi:transposase-like protein